MATSSLSRRSRPMLFATTTKPRAANITEDQAILQQNISRLAEDARNKRELQELDLRKRRLAQLQSHVLNAPNFDSMTTFIDRALERVNEAMWKVETADISRRA